MLISDTKQKVSPEISELQYYEKCKTKPFEFIRPQSNKIFDRHDLKGPKQMIRLHLNLTHLQYYKFNYDF